MNWSVCLYVAFLHDMNVYNIEIIIISILGHFLPAKMTKINFTISFFLKKER